MEADSEPGQSDSRVFQKHIPTAEHVLSCVTILSPPVFHFLTTGTELGLLRQSLTLAQILAHNPPPPVNGSWISR